MSEPASEFLCWLLHNPPRWEREEANVQVRVEGETYWVISGTDLRALLEAREHVLAVSRSAVSREQTT